MPQNRRKGSTLPIWVSQNFLTSYKIINRIICRTTLNKNDHVIEIGPGKGHTTGFLIKKCRKVSAIEIDGRLYNKLTAKFKDVKNIRIYHQDFLKWKLPKYEDYKVFSNIPFCFTTDIMRKLTECKNTRFFMFSGFAFSDATGSMCREENDFSGSLSVQCPPDLAHMCDQSGGNRAALKQ